MKTTSKSPRRLRAKSFITALATLLVACAEVYAATEESADEDEHVDHQTQQALQSDSRPARGAQLFDQFCSKCHGARAFGDARLQVPALAAQRFAYLVRQQADFAGGERDSVPMHRAVRESGLRRPQDWADIAGFLNHLPPDRSPQRGPANGDGLGRGIYHEQCATCHGADGGGDADGMVPSLRHQHYAYLVTQMHKLAAGRRHNVDESLMLFLRSFDDVDIDSTASYLSRLRGPVEDRQGMRADGLAVD